MFKNNQIKFFNKYIFKFSLAFIKKDHVLKFWN
jgi:hypothetical protein